MQQYERFGVLALLLLVVTLVAVALLGEDPRDPSRLEELAAQAAERPSEFGGAGRATERSPGSRPQGERPVPRRLDPRLDGAQERPAPTARRRPTAVEPAARPQADLPFAQPASEPQTSMAQTSMAQTSMAQTSMAQTPMAQTPMAQTPSAEPRPWPERAVPQAGTPLQAPAVPTQARPVQAVAAGAPTRRYTVQPGDCLGTILQEQCGTVRAQAQVMELNPGLQPDRLRTGQVLQLPAGTVEASFKRPGRIQEVGVLEVVVVQPGDSLYRILQRERDGKVSVGQVQACNPGLDPDLLTPGMELRLPQAPQRRSVPASRYIVREGDILGRIAVSLGCTLEELIAANPGLQPDRIRSGQVLLLPPGVGTALAGAQ